MKQFYKSGSWNKSKTLILTIFIFFIVKYQVYSVTSTFLHLRNTKFLLKPKSKADI